MSLRSGWIATFAVGALASTTLVAADAAACGGCFHQESPSQPETTLVTAHRMALSVSPTRTVLWDQIKYAGSPKEFAWVLPVKAGAYLELGSDAFFETLDAATSENVAAPQLACGGGSFGGNDDGGGSGCGCAAMSASEGTSMAAAAGPDGAGAPPAVSVVHQGTVGPYETVTLHANVKGALVGWLQNHGFAVASSDQPIIDAYSGEGFDFIALRLQPGANVQQMKPVRVVSPGAQASLPLRMVGVGTGDNVAVTLYVVGEGRWEAENFPNALIDEAQISWDFAAIRSNYADLRTAALAAGDGRTWLTTYAKLGPMLSTVTNPLASPFGGTTNVSYALADGRSFGTIAATYVWQGYLNGENGPNESPADCHEYDTVTT